MAYAKDKEIKFDFNNLRAEIRRTGLTQAEFAKKVGMTATTLSSKLNNRGDFTSSETFLICKFLKLKNPNPYFFTVKL